MSKIRPALPYEPIVSLLPGPILARIVARLVRLMYERHPKLFAAFGELEPAVIHVVPTGMPHRFVISFGAGQTAVRLHQRGDRAQPDAIIRGRLSVLIDLLEGRSDGDAMFFTRDLEIGGATNVIVAVRNTLEREEIDMRSEIAALFGPLQRPAEMIGRWSETAMARVQANIVAMHSDLHAAEQPERDVAAECHALRDEVKALASRLSKLTVKQARADAAAGGTL